MAEVLGVVSAAAQLATLCCSLLRVMKRIKSAGLTLQNYQLQLQDLSLLSSSISRNPLLQTSEIGTLTQSLLSLISQANLTFVLKKHRIIRTLYILCKERDLVDTLTAVERQKLSLCLSIEQIQSDALYEIRASLQDMSYKNQNVGKKRTAIQDPANATPPPSPTDSDSKTSSTPSDSKRSSAPSDPKTSPAPSDPKMSPAPSESHTPAAQADTSDGKTFVNNLPGTRTLLQGKISNIQIDGIAHANVGLRFVGNAHELRNISNSTEIRQVIKDGKGDLIVGPDLHYDGDINHVFDPSQATGIIDGVKVTFRGGKFKSGVHGRVTIGANLVNRGSGECNQRPQPEPEPKKKKAEKGGKENEGNENGGKEKL